MFEVIMIAGLPASGKTEIAKKYKDTHVVLSAEDIRREFDITKYDIKTNKRVFGILHKRLYRALKKKRSVVYDAPNLSYKKRIAFFNLIKPYHVEHTKIIMPIISYEECCERNKDKPQVNKKSLYEMYITTQIPHYCEGWDEIELVIDDVDIDLEKELKNGTYHLDQENPFQDFYLDDHMRRCYDYICAHSENTFLRLAAKYHDIGKAYTKTMKDGIAHYYQHENVSAYLLALYMHKKGYSQYEIIEAAFYAQNHMRVRTEQLTKAQLQDYKHLYGIERYNNLVLFHEADKFAQKESNYENS